MTRGRKQRRYLPEESRGTEWVTLLERKFDDEDKTAVDEKRPARLGTFTKVTALQEELRLIWRDFMKKRSRGRSTPEQKYVFRLLGTKRRTNR